MGALPDGQVPSPGSPVDAFFDPAVTSVPPTIEIAPVGWMEPPGPGAHTDCVAVRRVAALLELMRETWSVGIVPCALPEGPEEPLSTKPSLSPKLVRRANAVGPG